MKNLNVISQYLIRVTEVKRDIHHVDSWASGQEPHSEFSEHSDLFSAETEISANSSKKLRNLYI
jgi:hypothetical protein